MKRGSSNLDGNSAGVVKNTEILVNVLVFDPATKTITQVASVQLKYDEGDTLSGTNTLITGDELLIYYRIWKKRTARWSRMW